MCYDIYVVTLDTKTDTISIAPLYKEISSDLSFIQYPPSYSNVECADI